MRPKAKTIRIFPDEIKAIKRLAEYLYDEEQEHYESMKKLYPDEDHGNHIWLDIQRIKNMVEKTKL